MPKVDLDTRPTSSAQPLVWDLNALLDKLDGDQATVLALVEVFLADYARQLDSVESAAGQGDALALARGAHTLKGSAGALEAPEVAQDCQRLEDMGRSRDLAGLHLALERLRVDLGRLLTRLRAYLPD